MTKKFNKAMIMDMVIITLLVLLSICTIYTAWVFVTEFGYTPELGIYDTRYYSWNVGEYLKYGMDAVHYDYTNLNFIEIMSRIW